MGKITEIEYKEILKEEYDQQTMAQFYFFHNLLGLSSDINDQYEEYEQKNLSIRNKFVKEIKEKHNTKISDVIFDISALKSSVVLIAEI